MIFSETVTYSVAKSLRRFSLLGVFSMFASVSAMASPIPVATYLFDGNLDAEESGVASLVAIDPLSLNYFRTENVFGVNRTVYRFDGSSSATQQAGLSLDTTGLLDGDDTYSVDITFRFDYNNSTWESIFGVSNRTSDNAFYVSPTGPLQVYPSSLGPDAVSQNDWHRVTLTNNGSTVVGYLDGLFQFDLVTPSMNFSSYGGNPDRLIHFFVDNLIGGGQGEYADGSVAMIKLYDFELTEEEVPVLVPGPASIVMFLAGLLLIGSRRLMRQD